MLHPIKFGFIFLTAQIRNAFFRKFKKFVFLVWSLTKTGYLMCWDFSECKCFLLQIWSCFSIFSIPPRKNRSKLFCYNHFEKPDLILKAYWYHLLGYVFKINILSNWKSFSWLMLINFIKNKLLSTLWRSTVYWTDS